MDRVLVTGGSGFIGSNVIEELMKSFKVVNLDLKPSKNSEIEQMIGDIRDKELVEKAVENCDIVIHLAAQVSVPLSIDYPQKTFDINVQGTQNIIDAAHKFGIKRLIIASSAAVYGEVSDLPLKEESAGQCLSPYAQSKWENETQIMLAREKGLEAIALRFFNVYGPGQSKDGTYAAVIPKFVEMLTTGKQPIVHGDGLQSRDFIHVKDLVRAIESLLECNWKLVDDHTYNLASQSQTTILELIELINSSIVKITPNFNIAEPNFEQSRKGDIIHSYADISKISNTLNWDPSIEISQGIEELVRMSLNQ
ncbi:MAG: NAD-dependent epimerase/dehydratase family protein [Candidatus Poseidoniaceae archaeon]